MQKDSEVLVNNALAQTKWSGGILTERNWREVVRNRLRTVAWDQAVADVRPFLDPTADPRVLTPDNLRRLLG